MTKIRQTIVLEVPEGRVVLGPLWGPDDTHRRLLERRLDVRISTRGERITLVGDPEPIAFAKRVINELLNLVRGGTQLFLKDIEQSVRLLAGDTQVHLDQLHGQPVYVTADRRSICPKTPNQQRYLEAVANKDLVFAVGPAGTGKTFLAMAAAVAALRRHEVKRIILTRPAVEAGERLGFLPGSLEDKVNPYLRPLYDALYELAGMDLAQQLLSEGTIEVAPLAFMRGRTLNRAFVILDEAQNTTREQMKMFLTRLGHGSQAVVTGDVTQVDLERRGENGLQHATRVLADIDAIGVCQLTAVDVVRHPLVQAIVQAYDRDHS